MNNTNAVTAEEVEEIESYISRVYMWKEITKEALPVFEDINKANELWLWEVVRKNLEDVELTYEQIEGKSKELFGEDFSMKMSKEGTEYLKYDEEKNIYVALGIELDAKRDTFLLSTINKTQSGYEVEIIEYIEDYTLVQDEEQSEENVYEIPVENINEEKVLTVTSKIEQTDINQMIKDNANSFTRKKLFLKKDSDNLYLQRVEQI